MYPSPQRHPPALCDLFPSVPPQAPRQLLCLLRKRSSQFLEFYIKRIRQYASFLFVWFLSLNTLLLRFNHVVTTAFINNSFLTVAELYSFTAWYSIYLFLNIWVVSSFWLFQIELLWTRVYSHCMDMDISSLLDEPLEKGWLDHKKHQCVTFQETAQLFSKVVVPVTFPPVVYGSNSSTSLPTLGMVGLSNRLWF